MNTVNKSANEYFLTRTQFETRKNAGTLEVGAVYHITDDQNSVKVYTTETMQTSTLPAQTVPALTKAQIDTIHTLLSQGKYVMVDDGNGQYVVSESDNLYEEVRFTYMGMYLGYYLEGNNVVATYVTIGGGGATKYCHNIHIENPTLLTMSDWVGYVSLMIVNEDANQYHSTEEVAQALINAVGSLTPYPASGYFEDSSSDFQSPVLNVYASDDSGPVEFFITLNMFGRASGDILGGEVYDYIT